MHRFARESATALHAAITNDPVSLSVLEAGELHRWRLRSGGASRMPVGWYLWRAALWHVAAEHAYDVGIAERRESLLGTGDAHTP
jgi:hypothetical protein